MIRNTFVTSLINRLYRSSKAGNVSIEMLSKDNYMTSDENALDYSWLSTEAKNIIFKAEALSNREDIWDVLRTLPLDEFSRLLLEPDLFPKLVEILPKPIDPEVQMQWTGAAGVPVTQEAVAFLRIVELGFQKYTGKTLDIRHRIMDFGCGWGRFLALLLKYTKSENIYGVDPLSVSLDFCRERRIDVNLYKSDPLSTNLNIPYKVNLTTAFSVFTHTSPKTTLQCLKAVRNASEVGALFAFTIRPVEYWSIHDGGAVIHLYDEHIRNGFAYLGSNRIVESGEDTYGDASYSHEYIRNILSETGWQYLDWARPYEGAFQTIVLARSV